MRTWDRLTEQWKEREKGKNLNGFKGRRDETCMLFGPYWVERKESKNSQGFKYEKLKEYKCCYVLSWSQKIQ